MTNRWKIEQEFKDAMIRRVTSIIIDPTSSKREVVSASKVLIAAEHQNQQDQYHDEQADEGRNRFYAIADRLGLLNRDKPVLEGGASTDTESGQRGEDPDDNTISDDGTGGES